MGGGGYCGAFFSSLNSVRLSWDGSTTERVTVAVALAKHPGCDSWGVRAVSPAGALQQPGLSQDEPEIPVSLAAMAEN